MDELNNENELSHQNSENNSEIHKDFQQENFPAMADAFIGKERVTELVTSLSKLLTSFGDAKTQSIKLETRKVDTNLKLAEINKEKQKDEQRFISQFDLRSKLFSLLSLVIIFFSLYKLNEQGSIDKEFTKTIFTVVSSIVSIGGLNLVSEIIKKKK